VADRRQQIRQLIASRYDGLYLPPGSLTTRAGLVPAELEPCTACGGILIRDDFGNVLRRRKGRGWIRDAFKRRQDCTTCAGDGEVARDPMDAQRVRVGSSTTTATARPRRTVPCDRCHSTGLFRGERCPSCAGAGRRELHAFELALDTRDVDERDPLAAAIEERDRTGSYHELERALAGIRVHVNKPARYQWLTDNATVALRLIDEVLVPPPARAEWQLDPGERALLDLALAYIDSRMPATIRVPVEVRANARILRDRRTRAKGRGSDPRALEQRNREIRQHHRQGRSVQWLAAEYELSVATVYEILNGPR